MDKTWQDYPTLLAPARGTPVVLLGDDYEDLDPVCALHVREPGEVEFDHAPGEVSVVVLLADGGTVEAPLSCVRVDLDSSAGFGYALRAWREQLRRAGVWSRDYYGVLERWAGGTTRVRDRLLLAREL